MTKTRSEAEQSLKALEKNKLKIWPVQNINQRNQVAQIPPNKYGFASKCDLASYKSWLREVDVESFDQTTYVEGEKPKKTTAKAKGGVEDVATD